MCYSVSQMNTPGVNTNPQEPRGPSLLKKGLSHLHEAFADYMLVNPGCTLAEMAQYFSYTPAWICTVTRSDMFQAYLAERRKDVSALVHESLPRKLEAAAHMATEKLIQTLERTNDGEMIVDIFDKVLHRCGYAPSARTPGVAAGTVNVQQNFYMGKDDLQAARQALTDAHVERPRIASPLMQLATAVVEDSSEP